MILPADPSHLDEAWAILDGCRAELRARGVDQWDDVYPTRETVAADIVAGRLHVLLERGRCLGMVTLDERQDAEYATVPWTGAEPALVVHRLCVHPDAQGRGIGSRLMDHAESLARDGGYASVRLDAYTGNPGSAALYRRRGYREAGQVRFPRRELPFHCFELDLRAPNPSERPPAAAEAT